MSGQGGRDTRQEQADLRLVRELLEDAHDNDRRQTTKLSELCYLDAGKSALARIELALSEATKQQEGAGAARSSGGGTDRIGELANQAADELRRASEKCPALNSGHEGWAVLKEKMDELWEHVRGDTWASGEAGKEAIQIAAMALRFVLDLADTPPPLNPTTVSGTASDPEMYMLAIREGQRELERRKVAERALHRCLVASGADISGGIFYDVLPERAVAAVVELRKDYDDALTPATDDGSPSSPESDPGVLSRRVAELERENLELRSALQTRPRTTTDNYSAAYNAQSELATAAEARVAELEAENDGAVALIAGLDGPELRHWLGSQDVIGTPVTNRLASKIHEAIRAGRCELCGNVEETRPYGPGGKQVCFSCGMKDEAEAKRQFAALTCSGGEQG